jgi:hypothetical protein
VSGGLRVPAVTSVLTEESICFAVQVIDSSKVAEDLEALLTRRTGRRRVIPLRAVLVALLLLALDERALHLKSATALLFRQLPAHWRRRLGVAGQASTPKAFLARYRQVRYLFHLALEVIDPSVEVKNRIMDKKSATKRQKLLSTDEVAERRARLEAMVAKLVQASVEVCSHSELSGFDGSVGLDATPVPLYSRGPSKRAGTTASDPDGAWYVREGDHREVKGPAGRKIRKIHWALEATIAVMGRPPGSVPTHPNLILGISLGRPGTDPGGSGARLLASVRRRGYRAGYLGADRGYTQALPEHFHLPVRGLGYSLVMDYKATDLGTQANSKGALMIEGAFYCPAMPEALISASADHRAGLIDEATRARRVAARAPWRLVRKEGPDEDGYERLACPALGEHPKLCCPLRPSEKGLGKIPVLLPPKTPPKLCCQSAITLPPDVGARFRQGLAFGTEKWARTYAAYRNTIEGLNGYMKDPAHEALQCPARRRVRGIAAQSLFCGLLAMAANVRRIAAHRALVADGLAPKVAERARRRRMSITDYEPPPPSG